jgi:hypothetical protein
LFINDLIVKTTYDVHQNPKGQTLTYGILPNPKGQTLPGWGMGGGRGVVISLIKNDQL